MSTPLDTPAAVRRAAMDLLAQREHGQVELSRKLLRRGAAPELIEQARNQGLLNAKDEGVLAKIQAKL